MRRRSPAQQLHAHYYRTPDALEGKRVLVLGIGNSASDIAVEASRVAEETYLAMRRGAHIIPKFIFGVPTDHLTSSPLARGPVRLQQLGMAAMLRVAQGRVTDYGLPRPDHAVLHAHPTVSDELLTRLGHGDITVRPNIDRFEGSKVFFVDGTAAEVDTVVYCTGYKVTFPFLDERFVPVRDNRVDLYRRVVSPDHAGLYFVGLIQPLGAIMPLAEAQAAWVADLVDGQGALPSYDDMRRQIREYDETSGEAVRRVEAAHHPGRLPRLPDGDPARAAAVVGAGRHRPHRASGPGCVVADRVRRASVDDGDVLDLVREPPASRSRRSPGRGRPAPSRPPRGGTTSRRSPSGWPRRSRRRSGSGGRRVRPRRVTDPGQSPEGLAVLPRTTSSVGSTTCLARALVPDRLASITRRSSAADVRPFSAMSWRTVVSCGRSRRASGLSSKPTTERSSGTLEAELLGGTHHAARDHVREAQDGRGPVGTAEQRAGGQVALLVVAVELSVHDRCDPGGGEHVEVAEQTLA